MDDKAYKRLVRLLVWSWVLILVLFIILGGLGTYQLSQVRSIAIETGKQTGPSGPSGLSVVGPKGERGLQGAQGIQGLQGAPGSDGRDGRDGLQGIQGETGPQGPQGDQGVQGEQGTPGRAVYVRKEAGQLECRYEGNDEWVPIEECQ